MNLVKGFLMEEDGMGTVEMVMLIAVLVGIALLFRNTITKFVNTALGNIEGNEINPQDIVNGGSGDGN